jgi:hypothetical protein
MYLLTILLPTVAVRLCAKLILGILNILLYLFLGVGNYPCPDCSSQSLGG